MNRWLTAATTALAAIAGCGSDDIKLVPVTGTITAEGKPLAGARVSFMPGPGTKPETPGGAATGPEGAYTILWNDREGIAPGKYSVNVTPAFVPPPGVKVPDEFKDDPFMFQLSLGTPRASKNAPPPLVGDFKAEVTEKGGPYDFDLKPKLAAPRGAKRKQ